VAAEAGLLTRVALIRFRGFLFEGLQERLSDHRQALLKLLCAITIAAGPRFCSVRIAAVLAGVRIFDSDEIEILFPIRAFFLKRR
jgi:hypothetical protein